MDFSETIKRYNKRLEKLGYSEEALGWTKGNNIFRFEALVKEWKSELSNSIICDFGCGFGDFYGFLIANQPDSHFQYTGLDINNNLLEIGKEKYPQAHFELRNIDIDGLEEHYDFIFSSGVFNHKFENGGELEFIKKSIKTLFGQTNKGLAINFLSDKVEYFTENNYNSNPGKIIEFAYSLTNNIVLRNDYMPFEFTIYLRKDKPINREMLVFDNE